MREQLNNGLIPENIDVHCLAGLIKVPLHGLFIILLMLFSIESVFGASDLYGLMYDPLYV